MCSQHLLEGLMRLHPFKAPSTFFPTPNPCFPFSECFSLYAFHPLCTVTILVNFTSIFFLPYSSLMVSFSTDKKLPVSTPLSVDVEDTAPSYHWLYKVRERQNLWHLQPAFRNGRCPSQIKRSLQSHPNHSTAQEGISLSIHRHH